MKFLKVQFTTALCKTVIYGLRSSKGCFMTLCILLFLPRNHQNFLNGSKNPKIFAPAAQTTYGRRRLGGAGAGCNLTYSYFGWFTAVTNFLRVVTGGHKLPPGGYRRFPSSHTQTAHNAASCISMLKCPSASRCQCREWRLHLDARCEQMQGTGLHLASRCEKMQAQSSSKQPMRSRSHPTPPKNAYLAVLRSYMQLFDICGALHGKSGSGHGLLCLFCFLF